MSINVDEFVSVVGPAMGDDRPDALAAEVAKRWTCDEVCSLLHDPSVEVRRLAAGAAGLIGQCCCSQYLISSLHDEDESVHSAAEHAIWQVWFHCCKPEAREPFQHGMACLGIDEHEAAITYFHECHERDPKFAEAYHQCAIAHYLDADYDASMVDCEKTLELVPIHFGALSQLGHCLMQQHQWSRALESYESALRVNPRMPGVRMVAESLSRKLS